MHKIKVIINIILTGILSGCVDIPNRLPIAINARPTINSSEIVVTTYQKKLQSEALLQDTSPLANGIGAGFGIILGDALVTAIEKAQIKHAETEMQPITQALTNYDITNEFKINLQKALKQTPWLGVTDATFMYNLQDSTKKQILIHSAKNTTFFVIFTYKLNYHLNSLLLRANVVLIKKTTKNHQIMARYIVIILISIIGCQRVIKIPRPQLKIGVRITDVL